MKEERVVFPCGDISLEGVLHLPGGSGPFPAVVMCHPHPLFGGSMSNNIVLGVCQALVQDSIAAFRFNFRGVGGSQGVFDGGVGEQEDVRAALTFISSLEGIGPGRIGLAGYSFGAGIALSVAPQDGRVQSLALISPVSSSSGAGGLQGYIKPKLLISGNDDEFIPPQEFQRLIREAAEPKEHEIISGADHFWWGYEQEVGWRVASFFAVALRQAPPLAI